MTNENGLTYYGKANPLVETFDFVPDQVLFESADGSHILTEAELKATDRDDRGRMILEGTVQAYDTKNLNKREYPKAIWAKHTNENSDVVKKIAAGRMYGHLEHPKDGTTRLGEVAILMQLPLRMDESTKTVKGRMVVLRTEAGKVVEECIDAGGAVGISSRGTGSVDSKGVVQEDYVPETWDIVHNPSTPGAFVAPAKTKSTAEAVLENAMTLPPTPPELVVDEDTTPLSSVEQDVCIRGLEWIKSHTNLSAPNDLAMVHTRFRKWAKQRGAADKTLEDAWASFVKVYPLVAKGPDTASGDHGAPPSEPAKEGTGSAVEMPKPTTISTGESAVTTTVVVDASKAPAGQPVHEAAAKLLEEAKATIQTLTESNTKLTQDLETSKASLTEATAKVVSLQALVEGLHAEVDAAAQTMTALTAVDTAAQVRDAVEEAVASDARLAAFRDQLAQQASPEAVEAKAREIAAVVTEAAKAPAPRAPVADRLRARARVNEDRGLPAPAPAKDKAAAPAATKSEADAGAPLTEEAALRRLDTKPRSLARSAAAAIARLGR